MKPIYISLFFLFFGQFQAQNIDYTKEVIDSLSSSFFSGRGAVNNGEKKAADYIAKEYTRSSLKKFNNSYFQEFKYPINVFPGKCEVKIDEIELKAGQDFIIGASSGEVEGTFGLVWYNKNNIPNKKLLKKLNQRDFFSKQFIVIDDNGDKENKELFDLLRINVFGAAGIIILEDKLTHSVATTYNEFAIIHLKRESISRKNRVIHLDIEQKLITNYKSQNVIGYVEGEEHPDSIIILSAHYDHLGMMGDKVYFPGANDNASGVAMLLSLVYHYTHKELPKKTMVFIAFGAEESGLIGSKHFVDHPLFELDKINFVMNMDLMGTGGEGATIVNAKVFPKYFKLLDKINKEGDYLPQLKQRGKAANSDHYWFSEKGIPSFFIYLLGGIDAYHDTEDVYKTLPLTEFEDSFRLIRDFIDKL